MKFELYVEDKPAQEIESGKKLFLLITDPSFKRSRQSKICFYQKLKPAQENGNCKRRATTNNEA